ncbi:hypothetical protein GGI35DRAFT_453446 [Trichoderma velutinum]
MECLLSLSKDDGILFPVKLLVTSPTPTEMIRELFIEEDDDEEDDDEEEEEYDDDAQLISLKSFSEVNHMPEDESQLYPVPLKDIFNANPYSFYNGR